MKNLSTSTFLAALGLTLAAAPAGAASLLEVYQQALQQDPLIHEAEARRLAAQEAAPQARGFLLPQVSASGAISKTEVSGSQIQFIEEDDTFAPITFEQEGDETSWNLGLRQTIFRWDQFIGMKQANKIAARADVEYESAQQDLMVRVVQRYFEVLAAEDRLASIRADREAISRQLEQAKQRFEVGLIAITDVQESQAAYDQAIAAEIGAQRELATAEQLLREITGQDVPELAAPRDEFPLPAPVPASEEAWVDMAMEQNLALLASRFDEKIARDEISFRRSGHYPTVDLVAGRNGIEEDFDSRAGVGPFVPADSKIDGDSIGIEVTIPIFSGGRVSSEVREAVYLHRASREQLQRVARETERATRDAYLGVISEISRVQALKQAVQSSRTALEATQAGFEVGTRTIVDVLNSQRALYLAITNYYQSRYTYIGNVLRLQQASGSLQVQDLERVDRWLTEREPIQRTIELVEQPEGEEAADPDDTNQEQEEEENQD